MSETLRTDIHPAGAKPAVERVMRSFERSRSRIDIEFDPMTRMARSIRVENAEGTDDVPGGSPAGWPVAGVPAVSVGSPVRADLRNRNEPSAAEDETIRYLEEAVERHLRFVEARRRRRRELRDARRFEAQIARLFVVPGEV